MKSEDCKNQDICRKLVEREVHYCVSMMVHELAQSGLDGADWYEDVVNLCTVRPVDNSERIEEIDEELDEIEGEIDDLEDEPHKIQTLKDRREALVDERERLHEEQESAESSEIYEHWLISDWLMQRLDEYGETVGELFGLPIWGRQTTGQAIYLDGVIERIARDMEILVGQRNEWKV